MAMMVVPLLFLSGSASFYLMKQEMEEKGLEMPCIANSWSWDTKLGTTPGYKSDRLKTLKKEKKERKLDKDGNPKKKRPKAEKEAGAGGEEKKRRSKKPPPLKKSSEANPAADGDE